MSSPTISRISSEWLAERVVDRGAVGIGDAVAALIRSGEVERGAQLPTIREFARVTGTSVGTVLAAWNSLREAGLVETHRRAGTTVALEPTVSPRSTPFSDWSAIDLAQSAPDIALQPELGAALLSTLDSKNLNVFGREYMTERLLSAVAPTWPFEPEAWATAGGGTEALLLATAAAAPPGSLVAVDEPVGPGFLDTLRDLQLTAVGVAADAEGPTVASLREALKQNPVAFIFQPGAPFAVSHSVSPKRAAELAEVLAAHSERVWVVEDDSIGPLARSESPSIGSHLAGQVIRIRSYCKAFGIDVRTSVLAGSKELIDRTIALRSHGVGSNSRILQDTLAYLIGSAEAQASVSSAKSIYAARRTALTNALRSEGVTVFAGPESVVVWVEVRDETDALLALARQGISVGAGSKSFVHAPSRPLLRISITQLPDDSVVIGQLARTIAQASSASTREYFD
ncbi:aminotransferase class I/II-fold pyridoxal phosphate-dependent enzyme [Subtercola lobariae]|uniref:GntR family transcriptional regulator n=1 Tax=Subtercola lobariae TaxID=1588641 RepID=A0A917EWJ0_9MICO|nr:aminotransferase class I/II-fold pyridoxal phosphate-dependent enzyme [Subtercola lobariae]GGF22066.1 GntR family transcriptional regulator [Subtercola lobariae]